MANTLSYTDAVRILGGRRQSAVLHGIDSATSGLLLGAAVTAPALLGLLDGRAEFARLSGRLITGASARLTGASRRNRPERLAAAHTVIVIAAYFDALSGAGLPLDLSRARLSREDQIRLTAQGAEGARDLTSAVLGAGVAVPEPHIPQERYLAYLDGLYRHMSESLGRFLRGLAVWDELTEGERRRLADGLGAAVPAARRRYEEMLLDLMTDCDDMALWVYRRHQRAVESALGEMGQLLATPAAPDKVTGALRRAYAALLGRRIVETTDLPGGLDVPELERAYLSPAFQVAEKDAVRSAADESFWTEVEIREDLDRFLAGYLVSPRAQRAPMLVLGQPGAGKSVLSRVLAARLSDTGFLPIRVPLRDVDSSLRLQQQIEQAILAATTEQTTWPDLVGSTTALPVVILDGFDELLQATETSRTDFLQIVAEFQQREREQGRAAVVIVTSRLSVADRATPPPETLLLRLQPFDEVRIRSWVAIWNEANAAGLRSRGCDPLEADAVLTHPELAAQPLLLFLLALYDADGNALRRGQAGPLTTGELYEQLLIGFVRREIGKSRPHLSESQLTAMIEHELDRLGVVAFAMLNRSAQWVTEEAVDRDLRATLFEPATRRTHDVGVDALSQSELIFGRFFFVHRAQAIRGGARRRTYEFLHATFGEYLVARLTWRLLAEAVARDSVTVASRPTSGNELMTGLLSCAALTVRGSIVQFLSGMAAHLAKDERERWTDVVIRLFRQGGRGLEGTGYQPVPELGLAARVAAYTANLTLLATVVSAELLFGDLVECVEVDPALYWHDYALLWHSQLSDEGFGTMTQTLATDRCRRANGQRDIRLTLNDGTFVVPPVDPRWVFDLPERRMVSNEGSAVEVIRRRLHFETGMNDDVVRHAITPLLDSALSPSLRIFVSLWNDRYLSAAQALISVLLLPSSAKSPKEIAEAYVRCADIAALDGPCWKSETRIAYTVQLLAALAAHRQLPTEAAASVLIQMAESGAGVVEPVLHAAAAVLDQADESDGGPRVAQLVLDLVERHWAQIGDQPAAMIAVRRAIAVRARSRERRLGRSTQTGSSPGSTSAGELSDEVALLKPRLAALRIELARWRAAAEQVGGELERFGVRSPSLRTSVIAVSQTREPLDSVAAALDYADEHLGVWISTHSPGVP